MMSIKIHAENFQNFIDSANETLSDFVKKNRKILVKTRRFISV